jgi:hypothetical protein
VIVACEIVTDAVPVFVRVSVWELLEPVVTFPKVRLVALAANDPAEALVELAFAAGVPAPVKPVQPEMDRTVKRTTIVANEVGEVRWVRASIL